MTALTDIRAAVLATFAPPPRLHVSEWSEQFRHLSPESSAEPGRWRNARAPHLVAPMDRLSPYDPAERVVLKFSSQSGKTEVILNFVGYTIHLDPGPILAVQPNVDPMGESFSKDRIAPMLRDSPALRDKVATPMSRSSANTVKHKAFPGGHLTISGANSPAGLASRPIRFFLGDEVDRWEATKEGDPMLLARKRQQTYRARRRSKELLTSSPTYDDIGISREYAECRQQYEWQLACLHCGETQRPRITHYRWQERDASTVVYVCQHCGAAHTLADEYAVKATGRWLQVRDTGPETVGYWFNQWGSPFARWKDTLQEWIDAQGDSAKMQAVTNTAFCEGWEGVGDRADPHVLSARAEAYDAEVPDGVLLITMGVDCQGDRLEVEIVGWGRERESWSLAYEVLPGEPTAPEVWADLLELYRAPLRRADGTALHIAACCVDSGAFSQHVYEAVKKAKDKWFIPVKGVYGMTRAQVDTYRPAARRRAAKRINSGAHPEPLGVDSIKRTVYQYLAADKGKPGYSHFPLGRDDEYYQQLTGERLMVVSQRGKRPQHRWVPIHSAVEALDCRVYAYAAMLLRSPDWEQLVRSRDREEGAKNGENTDRPAPRPTPQGGGFIGQRPGGWFRR